jgi:PAS domain S-box-containing protein
MKKFHSLKKILTINYMIVSLMPLIIVGGIFYYTFDKHLRTDLGEYNLQIAKSIAKEVEHFLDEQVSHLSQVTLFLEGNIVDPSEINSALQTVLKQYPYFDIVQIVNDEGIVEYSTTLPAESVGFDLSLHKFYQKARAENRFVWSAPFMSIEKGCPAIILALPFNKGMVIAYFRLEYLRELIETQDNGKSGYACIADAEGNLLAHPNEQFVLERINVKNVLPFKEGLKGNEGSYQYTFNGAIRFGTVTRLPKMGWVVLYSQLKSVGWAPLSRLLYVFLGGLLLAFIVSLIFLFEGVRKILTPIDLMLQKTKKISDGDYTFDSAVHSYNELNTLMNNFQSMKASIQDREKRLSDSESWLKSIFRVAPIGIGVVVNRTITWVNDVMCSMIGYTQDELLNQSARMLYLNDEEFVHVGKVKYEQIKTSGTGTIETQFLKKDGTLIDILLSSTPIDPTDLGKGVTFTALDITDIKTNALELQQSRDDWENIFNSISDCVFILDPTHHILDINKEAIAILDMPKNEIIGKLCYQVIHCADLPPDHCPHSLLLKASHPETKEMEMSIFGGAYLVTASPVFDDSGKITKTILIAKNITESKKTRAELERLKEHLESEVKKKSDDLIAANNKLNRTERLAAMGQLAGTVAHEFRNQLGVMRNVGYLLKLRLAHMDEKTRKHLDILDEQIVTTDRIIENILTFARVKKPHMKLIHVSDIVLQVLSKSKFKSYEKVSIETSLTKDDELYADEVQLFQIFDNLINNAVEAVKNDGHVEVIVDRLSDAIIVKVIDDGYGIDHENLTKIFDPLFTTKARGAGLGLSTVKLIVEAHSGHISVDSTRGEGTVVTVSLPIEQPN